MKFSQVAILYSLLTATVLAAPRGQKARSLNQRIQRRASNNHVSGPLRASTTNFTNAASIANGVSDIDGTVRTEYSSNWSGAILTSPPSGQTFNAVSGTFTVPTPLIPNDATEGANSYAASAWVGIDGDTYSSAILQTGIDFTVTSSGKVSFDAWYEWFPDSAYDFELTVSAGDVINLSVVATTSTSGTATIENETTGEGVTIDLTSSSALGGQNAEWIVEDFEEDNELVAFADFGTVIFTGATASTSKSSKAKNASSATIINIESDSGTILTDVTVDRSTVVITYQ